ncbi:BglG family transcription antiterminator [Lentibacillus cibarius]|uniref:BglG family transcription antiterminator n=1 Tax=Lentibacillus cibarius TaxID=2583219 RepID=A0A5S3QI84_9BACI|nr:BglG family transcription antiterminator [Lentibacillus cibarius]TMN21612.1 BglG family transcription antiterminator [Lentibacillus cibarius]
MNNSEMFKCLAPRMNNRQKELMHLLLTRSNEFVLVKTLAEELDCSEKTVRNDLNQLEKELAVYSSLEFVRKPGMGVALKVSNEEKSQLFRQLYQSHRTREHEQIVEITYQLLVSNKPITLTLLAEKYYTNKLTIKRYFQEIADWLKYYDLELVSKQRVGSVVQGSELNKRNALAHLSELVTSEIQARDYVLQLFPEHEINTVRKALRDLQAQFSFSLNTGEFESLLIHALIMIKRTRQHSPVAVNGDKGKGRAVTLESYHMTAWLLKQLKEMLGLKFPENEHIYFTWHLESCKQTQRITNLTENSLLTQVVQTITQQLEQMTMLRFQGDRILFDGLTIHLESVINRLQYGFTIRNPMLEEIKKKYPYMFSMVIFAVEEVNETYDLAIPEHEAAYLVLHFQASLERMQKEHTNRKRAVIVCELGVGMSHLLQVKLEQMYEHLDILASISKAELEAFLQKHAVDIIISTTAIPDASAPVIVVSPLLEADDKKRLNQWMRKSDGTTSDNHDVTALRQLLYEDTIFFDMQLSHRYEVVEMMAGNLTEKGYTNQSFVHSAVQRERSSATSIGGSIAIPHAHPDLVKKSVVSVAILPKPLSWGNEQVSVVFLLAIAKQDQHMIQPLMQTIASISQNPALVEQLKEAADISDILRTLDK